MTKQQTNILTELMYEAIHKGTQSELEYLSSEKLFKQDKATLAETELRKADQHYGYCSGITQVLACLKFQHKDMEILQKFL